MRNNVIRHVFEEALRQAGLMKQHDELLSMARECVHFFYDVSKKSLPIGVSKVGGMPHLPDSIEWPEGCDDDGHPCGKAVFLAQFRLADIPPIYGFDLPRTGHLWIFVKNEYLISKPVAIFYREEGEPLRPRAMPASQGTSPTCGWRELNVAALRFQAGITLPFSAKKFREKFDKVEGLNKLQECLSPDLDNYGSHQGPDGQIGGYSYQAENDLHRWYAIEELGYPDYIDSDCWNSMEELLKQIERGFPFAKNDEAQQSYRDHLQKNISPLQWILENDQKIQSIADSLKLLCMFRPSMEIGLEYGDGMYMDFLIRREALAQRDFDKVYCCCPMLL